MNESGCSCHIGRPPCSWCMDPDNNPDKPKHSEYVEDTGTYDCISCGMTLWDPHADVIMDCECDKKITEKVYNQDVTEKQVERALDFIRNLR